MILDSISQFMLRSALVYLLNMNFSHAAHRALALWALGAPGDAIREGYKGDCTYEKPAVQSPATITEENFEEYLGDHRYSYFCL
jgi:Questin oxidase-like